jgi:sodium transport system permease protein
MASAPREIGLLYWRELRAALREKNVVLNTILVPLLLYPVLLWLIFTAMSFAQGQEEKLSSRIAVAGEPALVAGIRTDLAASPEPGVELALVEGRDEAADRAAILAGDLDLRVAVEPAEPAGNFLLRLIYDSSKDRSAKAAERVESFLRDHRRSYLDDLAERMAIAPIDWRQFHLLSENVSSSRELGAFLLGLLAPTIMMVMIVIGCFFPAVDSTAGERERSTWETTLSLAASRTSVLIAKYLYVATLGLVAGLLNLFAMTLSMPIILGPLLANEGNDVTFQIPWTALPLMVVAAALLAMLVAAAMMILASFARTFKEGQSMVGPIYLLAVMPTVLVSSPDLELTARWALVPVANVALLFRAVIAGSFPWPAIALTLLVELVCVVACLAVARWIASFEEVLIGSYGGELKRFLRERWRRGSQA